MGIEALIVRFGLAAVFVGAAIEGDVTLILAGVTAHLGLLDLPAAAGLGALGGFASDLACYGLGRSHAAAIRNSRIYRRAGPTIERVAARLGPRQIPVARFVYGTRVASMLFWGMRGLPLWRFAAFDLPGCVLWAAVFCGLGYMLSGSAAALIGEVKRVEIWLAGALCVSALFLAALRLLARSRRMRDGS
ncbi:MAG TPA: VTT domain-containing protein [Candidatus Polarisedimenticolia bacterium]|nr:VTT domain-containing protein [Candidatus Polarisedimenticolia bacterium]